MAEKAGSAHLDEKRFYLTLEGVRGLAAAMIFARHSSEAMKHVLFHSYLAVDLFFILSGFVLSTAYDRRLADRSLSAFDFLKLRAIRLYPLFFLSHVIALAASLLAITYWGARLTSYAAWLPGTPLTSTAAGFLFSLLMLPSIFSHPLYPLNASAWSLMYELVVNFLYALARRVFSRRFAIAVLAALGCSVIACLRRHRGLDVGLWWSEIPEGFFRAAYSFGAGLLLARIRRPMAARITVRHSSLLGAGLLVLAGLLLAMPSRPGFDVFYDALAVFVLFPALVLAASWIEPGARCRNIFAALGISSYGVYILQGPVSALIAIGYSEIFAAKISPYAAVILLPCLIAAALVLDAKYDKPLRLFLRRVVFHSDI